MHHYFVIYILKKTSPHSKNAYQIFKYTNWYCNDRNDFVLVDLRTLWIIKKLHEQNTYLKCLKA